MNGARYEQGTPAYHSKPRSRAASTKWRASIIRRLRAARAVTGRTAQRSLGVREVDCLAEILQVIDAAPMAMHIQHFDLGAIRNQCVHQGRHIQRVEIRL